MGSKLVLLVSNIPCCVGELLVTVAPVQNIPCCVGELLVTLVVAAV